MTAPETGLAVRRSFLFTPANRTGAFDKALGTRADAVCLDLEDAVPPDQKSAARGPACAFLAADLGDRRRGVRINGVRSAAGLADLLAVSEAGPSHGFVMLPKVDEAGEVRIVDDVLTEAGSPMAIGALIETAAGLEQVFDIAASSARLEFLLFGAVDLAAEFGIAPDEGALAYARARVVHAAKRHDLDVLDVPELAFHDLALVEASARRAIAHGFTGKAAIHPSNVDTINGVFTPSEADVDYARRAVAAFEAAPNGLAVLDGKLIEAPVVRALRRKLAIAAVTGTR